MTFIAIATTPSGARIVTDTWAYTKDGGKLGHSTKVSTLLHLDAAIATQGNLFFGIDWTTFAASYPETPTFDQLVDEAPALLRRLYDVHTQGLEGADLQDFGSALVLHVGKSSRAGGYTIVGHSSLNDFEPEDLGSFFVTPTPFDQRPSDYEAAWIRSRYEWLEQEMAKEIEPGEEPWIDTMRRDNLAYMLEQPAGTAPTSTAGWIDLAERSRLDRARKVDPETGLKVLVGGKLHMTVLDRLGVTQRVVHEFNDQGDELLEVLAGTDHPLAQAAENTIDA